MRHRRQIHPRRPADFVLAVNVIDIFSGMLCDARMGDLEQFAPLDIGRKIYIHINNSNPALRENSRERAAVEAAGWEVSYDGMEIRV